MLGVGKLIAVGYSMRRSLVAQRVWYRHSERVEGLALCASPEIFARVKDKRWGVGLFATARTGVGCTLQADRFVPARRTAGAAIVHDS